MSEFDISVIFNALRDRLYNSNFTGGFLNKNGIKITYGSDADYIFSVICDKVNLKFSWLDSQIHVSDPTFDIDNLTRLIVADFTKAKMRLDELREIVNFSSIKNDKRYKPRTIEIECSEGEKLVFSTLKKISEFFGTEEIDVNSESRDGGYCETCSYSYSVNLITITNPTKNIDIRS